MEDPKPYRVLVAEDDEAFLELLAELLEADGRFAVIGRAANGRDAVELARELPLDAVVMDIELPVLDGVEATRLIQELRPGLPVVAISGHDYEERVLDIRSAGAARLRAQGPHRGRAAGHARGSRGARRDGAGRLRTGRAGGGTRTHDLPLQGRVLYQLSYSGTQRAAYRAARY